MSILPPRAVDRLGGWSHCAATAPVHRVQRIDYRDGRVGLLCQVTESPNDFDGDVLDRWRNYLAPVLRLPGPEPDYERRPTSGPLASRATSLQGHQTRPKAVPARVRRLLTEATGTTVRPLVLLEGVPLAGVVADVPEDMAAEDVIATVRDKLPPGWIAFIVEPTGSVAIGPGNRPSDVVRLVGTDGINYGWTVDDVARRVDEWDDRFGVVVERAGLDRIGLTLLALPADPMAFAREVYEFCPDVVDQGTQILVDMAEGDPTKAAELLGVSQTDPETLPGTGEDPLELRLLAADIGHGEIWLWWD